MIVAGDSSLGESLFASPNTGHAKLFNDDDEEHEESLDVKDAMDAGGDGRG